MISFDFVLPRVITGGGQGTKKKARASAPAFFLWVVRVSGVILFLWFFPSFFPGV